jgi:hypothetical protein
MRRPIRELIKYLTTKAQRHEGIHEEEEEEEEEEE